MLDASIVVLTSVGRAAMPFASSVRMVAAVEMLRILFYLMM